MSLVRGLSIVKSEPSDIKAIAQENASASLTLSSAERDPATLRAKPNSVDASKTDLELIGGGGVALISSGSVNQQTNQLNQDITISNSGVVSFQQTPKVLTQNVATEQHVASNYLPKSGPTDFFGTLTLTDPPVSNDPASANNHLMRKQETDLALATKVDIDGAVRLTGTKTFASSVVSETAASNDNELIRKGEVDTLLLSKASTSIFTGNVTFAGNNTHSGFVTMSGGAAFTNGVPSCSAAPSGSGDLTNKAYVDSTSSLTGNEAQRNTANTFSGVNTFTASTNAFVPTSGDVRLGVGLVNPGRSLVIYDDDNVHLQLCTNSTGTTSGNGFELVVTGSNKRVFFDQRESSSMHFRTASTDRFLINSNGSVNFTGNVKMGSGTPSYPLQLGRETTINYSNPSSSASGGISGVRYWHSNKFREHQGSKSLSTSIFANGSIVTKHHFAALSDARIKKDITNLDDGVALAQIRQLKPSVYKYKDYVNRGSDDVIGFIAQEVEEAIPRAVNEVVGNLPNILLDAVVSEHESGGMLLTIPTFDTGTLERTSSNELFTRLCIIIEKDGVDEEIFGTIKEIISPTELVIVTDTSNIDDGVVLPEQIFVYGQEVDNIHVLAKDRIFTVATAAIQELDRQVQDEKAKRQSLEQQVLNLAQRVETLERK
jgi:hypothetical protein